MSKPVIVCVDDDVDIQDTIARVLNASLGDRFSLEIAGSASETLEIIKNLQNENRDIPVLLADYLLPVMKGDELLRKVKKLSPKTLGILITGHGTLDMIANVISDPGLYCYIAKPWDNEKLIQAIEEASRRYFNEKHMEEIFREQKRYLASLMSNLPGVAYRRKPDQGWTMQFMSEGVISLTGYTPYELMTGSLSYTDLIHPIDQVEVQQSISECLARREKYTVVYRIHTRAQEEKWVWEQGNGVYSEKNELLALEGFITDITERKRTEEVLQKSHDYLQTHIKEVEALQEKLREEAIRDSLTGIFNRRYLEETLDREIARACRDRMPVGVMMMDLDFFKEVNDTHGHAGGDLLLKAMGNLLRTKVRLEDIPCRYGGEEFVLVMPNASIHVAIERAELIRMQFDALHIPYNNKSAISATLSIGVAAYPEHGSTREELLQHADLALYQAKESGRDRVIVYNNTLSARQEKPSPVVM